MRPEDEWYIPNLLSRAEQLLVVLECLGNAFFGCFVVALDPKRFLADVFAAIAISEGVIPHLVLQRHLAGRLQA